MHHLKFQIQPDSTGLMDAVLVDINHLINPFPIANILKIQMSGTAWKSKVCTELSLATCSDGNWIQM
jgi:hypothetical protein